MRERPYLLVGASQLADVWHAAEGALAAWCRDWGVARDELTLECLRAWEGAAQLPAAPVWRPSWRRGGASLALAWGDEAPAQMQRLLFGAGRHYAPVAGPARLVVAAGEAAWQALQEQLATALLPAAAPADAAAPPDAAEWREASGAVLLVLRFGQQACHLVLGHAAMARYRPLPTASAALAPLDYHTLLAALPVALPVRLGGAQVDLGSLTRLSAGDVIRLDRAADLALTLHGPTGVPLFDGYLGRLGGQMALELAPHDFNDGVKHER